MNVLPDDLEFEWNEGNLDKSYKKHGISPTEAEEIFTDENILIVPDTKHSEKEERMLAIGKTAEERMLFAVFVIRKHKIRIISVRPMHKKEVSKYEKA